MKFNEKLVLNSYLLSLFGVENFDDLAKEFKDGRLEHHDENNNTGFYNRLKNSFFTDLKFSMDKLLEYDENIVRHTLTMGRDIKWKYFQYLSLLFVEVYLDKYFNEKDNFLTDLNNYLEEFNKKLTKKEQLSKYNLKDLNKIALYNATGSGKTLLMHINLMQFNHYSKNKMKINKTILITPNSGLSIQHIKEFNDSNINARIFSKEDSSINSSKSLNFKTNTEIEVIEITKLAEDDGNKTVAVDSFEDNNLIFIDEGHRGAKADKWKPNRDKLSANGFAFEYSATFAQAINSATKKKKELENEYTKSIIFDYSYKYFYNDGYGKDYSILNLSDDSENIKQKYLTASLLSFYQQMKIFETSKTMLKPYLIEKPLMVFVGSSVNAVFNKKNDLGRNIKDANGKDIKTSDVIDILLFINEFVKNKNESINNIKKIISLDSGLNRRDGSDIFSNKFSFLSSLNLNENYIFNDMLNIIFNSNSGLLHIEDLKGSEGEIGLKVGESSYFGVINVGDSNKLTKLCAKNGITVTTKAFSKSLFKSINENSSNLHILIGSRKFSEGWNSWRVSTMGLMNIGKTEGSQIIQLFGRGVRLKGYDFCLKRSRAVPGEELGKKYQAIETLNIFGLKADYMKAFKDYLKEEGVPSDERIEFILDVKYDNKYKTKKLKILDLQKGRDFKKEVKLDLKYSNKNAITKKIVLSLYKQVDMLESKRTSGKQKDLKSLLFKKEHLNFINIDNLFFALQEFKNEKNWSNINISKKVIYELLKKNDWYLLYLPKSEMKINNFKDFYRFEKIMITLLKKYMKSFYEYKKSEWESQLLEYRILNEENKKDKSNLIKKYTITVEDKEIEVIERLKNLEVILKKNNLDENELNTLSKNDFTTFLFNKHLYNPLIFKNKKETALHINPIQLNDGEKDFIDDLDNYLKQEIEIYKNTDIFLLRNQSKTGLGFFAESNFYPDFIMWIIKDEKQYITFIDPKGIRNSNPKDDPKLNFSTNIKDIQNQPKVKDNNTILNSFIISNTALKSLNLLHSNLTYDFFEEKNVLFQNDKKDSYIKTMFNKILNN